MKKFFVVTVLALSTLTAGSVSSKSYEINLSKPTKVGNTQLKAGRYRLVLEGTQATITETGKSKNTVTVPVKVEESDKKFENTRIITSKDGDVEKIDEIDLGGSKTKLAL
jgi:hypothetical protein